MIWAFWSEAISTAHRSKNTTFFKYAYFLILGQIVGDRAITKNEDPQKIYKNNKACFHKKIGPLG